MLNNIVTDAFYPGVSGEGIEYLKEKEERVCQSR